LNDPRVGKTALLPPDPLLPLSFETTDSFFRPVEGASIFSISPRNNGPLGGLLCILDVRSADVLRLEQKIWFTVFCGTFFPGPRLHSFWAAGTQEWYVGIVLLFLALSKPFLQTFFWKSSRITNERLRERLLHLDTHEVSDMRLSNNALHSPLPLELLELSLEILGLLFLLFFHCFNETFA
jgi:hypothetical protein